MDTADHNPTKILVTLPRDESAALDAARGSIPRATWIREAVRRALGLHATLPVRSEATDG